VVRAEVLSRLVEAGVDSIRVSVGWWMVVFDGDPVFSVVEGVVEDPYTTGLVDSGGVEHVCGESAFWTTLVADCARLGLGLVVDIHAMPGGYADGDRNGVATRPPVFWKYAKHLLDMGGVDAGILVFERLSAIVARHSVVRGMCLSVFAGVGLPHNSDALLAWLERVMSAHTGYATPLPTLHVHVDQGCMDVSQREFEQCIDTWAVGLPRCPGPCQWVLDTRFTAEPRRLRTYGKATPGGVGFERFPLCTVWEEYTEPSRC
jgi:hypothetical protein